MEPADLGVGQGDRGAAGPGEERGGVYLRRLRIHGARAVLAAAAQHREPDSVRAWALGAAQRLGHNQATVALANKLARFAFAVATHERAFEARREAT